MEMNVVPCMGRNAESNTGKCSGKTSRIPSMVPVSSIFAMIFSTTTGDIPVGPGHGPLCGSHLKPPPAGEILIFDQGDFGLHARGVAVHHKCHGPGGGHDSGLAIRVAMFFAHFQREIPYLSGLGSGSSDTPFGVI